MAGVAVTLVSMLLAASTASSRLSNVDRHRTGARYMAEGATEAAKKQVQSAIANSTDVPTDGSVAFDGEQVDYTITPTGFSSIVTDPTGLQTLITAYEISATATLQGGEARVRRIVNTQATPLFQYAVFYSRDLEILPGPDMVIRGRVHTNKDLYLGSNASLTLDTNYVRAVGNVYRRRKDDPAVSSGIVNIRRWVMNPFNAAEPSVFVPMPNLAEMTALGVPTASGFDSDFQTGYDADANGIFTDLGDWLPWGPGALEYWRQPDLYATGSGQTVLNGEHGIGEAVVPEIKSIAMFEPDAGGTHTWDAGTQRYVAAAAGAGTHKKGYYHDNADLSVITYPNGTWKAFTKSGTDVSGSVSSAISITSMYDGRQDDGTGGEIPITQIDIGKLASTSKFPKNGLLYAAHYGAGPGLAAKGIRLKNGATLPGKLTVASEDPVYIQGDYNTSNKKGAAVIADAVNLLSKAWDDGKSKGSLPVAADTTYNVAMISGNQETSVGSYNGGLENLPRFHENWSGKVCTIKGSFVNTWESKHATGSWVYGGDRYTAPNRNWSYDPAFNNVANLPPFTPIAVTAVDVVTW